MRVLSTFAAAMTLAVTVGASAAEATPVTFDFQGGLNGPGGTFSSITTTQDGIAVTVTAGTYNGSTDQIIDTGNRVVTKSGTGLGVDCPGVLAPQCFNGIGLGVGIPDLLTLTFDQVVDFSSVLFTLIDSTDNFDLWIDGVHVADDVTIFGSNPYSLDGPLNDWIGTSISFGADSLSDNFRLGSITVAAVPLPAGGLLLLGGLAGLAALRRRRTMV